MLAAVEPVALICNRFACPDPRFLRTTNGRSSMEKASDGAERFVPSFAKYPADPAQRLPLQVPAVTFESAMVEGRAVVGEFRSGRSKVSVAKRLELAVG